MKTVSVIIPCRNAEKYLSRALDSVSDQEFSPIEVIVIDDGSVDNSVEIARQHPVVTMVLDSNWRNGAGTRNVGVEKAVGDWVAFLDADDYWLPNHLRQAVALVSSDHTVAYMAHRRNQWVGGKPFDINLPFGIVDPTDGIKPDVFLSQFIASGMPFYMSSVLYKRNRLVEVGLFDSSQVRRHDIELWFRMIAGCRWAFHSEPATVYQMDTPGSISSNVADREYWFYIALKKNEPEYRGPVMDNVLAAVARRACVSMITDGDPNILAGRWHEMRGALKFRDFILVKIAIIFPNFFRKANLFRRSICFARNFKKNPQRAKL